MAQILVPTTDSGASGLLNESASSSNLFQSVDEGATPNNSDYYGSTSPTPGQVDHQLTAGSDPAVSTGHVIHLRAMDTGGVGSNVTIYLYQGNPGSGGSLLKSWVGFSGKIGTPTDSSYTLSGGEADSITNYADLWFRVEIGGTGKGGAGSGRVHNVYLEVPDAASSGPVIPVFMNQYRQRWN